MRKVICSIDTTQFKKKPNKNIGTISNRLLKIRSDTTLENLVEAVSEGKTILPFKFSGNKRSKNNFIKTNLILLDFDNKSENFSVEDCLDMQFTKDNASFLYETFSSTEEIPKFRLVFVLSKEISSKEEFYAVYEYLLSKYPQADKACNDCARMFFGGTSSKIINLENLLEVEELNLHIFEEDESVNERNQRLLGSNLNVELLEAYRNFNVPFLKAYFLENLNPNLLSKNYANFFDFIQFIYKLDMYTIFDFPRTTFNCILQKDNTPSCSIMRTDNNDDDDNNIQVYKRFSDEFKFTYNNFQLIKKLTGKPEGEVVTMLLEVLDSKVNTLSLKEKTISELKTILYTETGKSQYPYINKILGKHKSEIVDTLSSMFNYTIDYKATNSFLAIPYSEKLAYYVYGADSSDSIRLDTKKKKIVKIQYTLTYLGIISNLKNSELSEKLFNQLYSKKLANKSNNRANVFNITFNVDWDSVENSARILVENKITIPKMTSDNILMLDGEDKLKSICVQSKKEKATSKIQEFRNDLANYISNDHAEGIRYILVSDIKAVFLSKYGSKRIKEDLNTQLISLQDTFDFEIVFLSKALREQLNINPNIKKQKLLLFN